MKSRDIKGVVAASCLFDPAGVSPADTWCLDTLAGRLVEIPSRRAPALMTMTAALVLQAQRRGELAAWVGEGDAIFYPPDFARSGIDLAALPVVRVETSIQAARAADALLRSGGFALVVLDLGQRGELRVASQTRLSGLARKHNAVLLCITRSDRSRASLGSLVSIRAEMEKKRSGFNRFTCELHVVKDKRTGPGWGHVEVCCGPDGLC